jgi:hypothetical protein
MRWISLFPTVKTAALYIVPIKSYSKNTHPAFFLKWAVVLLFKDHLLEYKIFVIK